MHVLHDILFECFRLDFRLLLHPFSSILHSARSRSAHQKIVRVLSNMQKAEKVDGHGKDVEGTVQYTDVTDAI